MKKRATYLISIILAGTAFILSSLSLSGQISSAAANRVKFLDYVEYSGSGDLFVFYQPGGILHPGSLTASLPGTGPYNFDWSRYNPATASFEPYFSESDVESSEISDLGEGGYQVHIWNGTDIDTFFLGWVMLDALTAELEKTADGKVKPYKYTCDFLVISGSVTIDTFIYYDPVSKDTIPLDNEYHFKYTSDNPDLDIPNDTTVLDPNYTESPPVVDTWYILTARDDLGMTVVDSVFYETIHTRAEFTVEYKDKVQTRITGEDVYDPDLTGEWNLVPGKLPEKGSLDALLYVKFINKSINGSMFEWVYLDTIGATKEYEYTYDLETEPVHMYEDADRYYYPYLVSISEEQCQDTFRLEEAIYVEPSDLVIPNVFTPNGDNNNDIFFFKHQSLKSCKLTIIDRFGKVVYKMQTDNIYDWEGWDGNVRGSGRPAPEGQYYYIVEAWGYDGIEYRDPNILEQRKNKTDNNKTSGTSGQDPTISNQNLYTGWLYLFRGSGAY